MDESELFVIILVFFIGFVSMKMITCDRFIEGLGTRCGNHDDCPSSQFCGPHSWCVDTPTLSLNIDGPY